MTPIVLLIAAAALALWLVPAWRRAIARVAARAVLSGLLAILGTLLIFRGQLLLGGALIAAAVLLGSWRHVRERLAARPPMAAMSVEEALAVLGLNTEASADEIRAAHRALIQKLHPDHGGTSYLAAKLNHARDVLLRTR